MVVEGSSTLSAGMAGSRIAVCGSVGLVEIMIVGIVGEFLSTLIIFVRRAEESPIHTIRGRGRTCDNLPSMTCLSRLRCRHPAV